MQRHLRKEEEEEKGRDDDGDQSDPSAIGTPGAVVSVSIHAVIAVDAIIAATHDEDVSPEF